MVKNFQSLITKNIPKKLHVLFQLALVLFKSQITLLGFHDLFTSFSTPSISDVSFNTVIRVKGTFHKEGYPANTMEPTPRPPAQAQDIVGQIVNPVLATSQADLMKRLRPLILRMQESMSNATSPHEHILWAFFAQGNNKLIYHVLPQGPLASHRKETQFSLETLLRTHFPRNEADNDDIDNVIASNNIGHKGINAEFRNLINFTFIF